ncbi:MAG TPA: phosphoribosyltransferase family protein [Candidatus Paceibacterota bacterium]|nr:phosphoribosyltransferase family protein [Candidatus Paceibacterota bacterium]
MNEADVLDIYQKVGGFRSGHFVFVSGLHANTYINKNAVYPYTGEVSKICRSIAERFAGKGVEVVVGPATGGIILSQWVAHHLSDLEGREVYSAYADKDGEDFIIKRGYEDIVKGRKTLVVEDLVTTGGSLKKVIAEARQVGGDVVGAVAVVNRGGVTKKALGNPDEFVSMLTVHMEQWPEAECDLCKRNIPINTDVGHGKEYLARKRAPAAV